MRTCAALLLLATLAWAQDCPFCQKPMVRVPVREAVHYFCSSCSCTVYANPNGPATVSVRVRGARRTFLLIDKEMASRRHWEVVTLEDEADGAEARPGHPVTRPEHPVQRPGHPVSRPSHPVALPGDAVKRPSHSVERPSHPVQRPTHAVKRPAPAVERPSHPVARPAPAVQRPAHAISKPGHAVQLPGHPVSRPGNVVTPPPVRPTKADGPALVLAPRKWSPPVERAPARRYGS
jgi:hypothetical protein